MHIDFCGMCGIIMARNGRSASKEDMYHRAYAHRFFFIFRNNYPVGALQI